MDNGNPENPSVGVGFLKLGLICLGVLLFAFGLMKLLTLLTQ
jgi:hypothetical protein